MLHGILISNLVSDSTAGHHSLGHSTALSIDR